MANVTTVDPSMPLADATPATVASASWHDAQQGLRLLMLYRFMTPLFQAGTMLIVAEQFHLSVASGPVLLMLAVELLVAVATVLRLRMQYRVSALELQLQATADIVLFTIMLYLTGGTANPFAPLYVLPVMIVGMALPPRRMWLLAVLTMVCYALLREHHVELSHPQGEGEVYRLHENGMIINYMLTSAMLVFFSTQLVSSLRRHAQQAHEARNAQMRNEAVATIGGMAAGAAHELGSPIGTVALIASELRLRYPNDPHLQEDLKLIETQMLGCKEILTRMANAGGVRRAESASGSSLDDFIRSTVRCVLSTNPGATIDVAFDGAKPAPRIVVEESLRQTLGNIVKNAVWVSPRQVRVSGSWEAGWLTVTVSDSGPGFDSKLLDNLGKGPVSSRWPERGMGVGLLLGAQTVQNLGGSMEFSNQAAGGACVRLRVPLSALSLEVDPRKPGAPH